jgi:hypothetical protein
MIDAVTARRLLLNAQGLTHDSEITINNNYYELE